MILTTAIQAQDQGGEDLDRLEKKVDNLQAQIQALRDQQQQGQEETELSFDEFDEQLTGMMKSMSGLSNGKRDFVVTGSAGGGYTNAQGQNSNFFAGFAPIFLWKINDDVFFESEVEFGTEGAETITELETAQLSYVINDSMILGFGKFLSPANVFGERLHPNWINKLPDAPLAVGARRIIPDIQTGVQLHGAVPVGDTKLNYAVYVSNGPALNQTAADFGSLTGENLTDTNNDKAVGGRIGFFLLPEFEVGYAFERSSVTASGGSVASADATIQSVDLNYVGDIGNGTLDVRSQWAFSRVDTTTFDPLGTSVPPFGPITQGNNRRSGGYVQAAFRPSQAESDVLSRFEGVVRYDMIDLPRGAPDGVDEARYTFGVNYWTDSSSVFKMAYQRDHMKAPGKDADVVMFQWALGF